MQKLFLFQPESTACAFLWALPPIWSFTLLLQWGSQPKIWFGHNFQLEDPIDLRPTHLNCILQDLFRDTPLDHDWHAQICIFIWFYIPLSPDPGVTANLSNSSSGSNEMVRSSKKYFFNLFIIHLWIILVHKEPVITYPAVAVNFPLKFTQLDDQWGMNMLLGFSSNPS